VRRLAAQAAAAGVEIRERSRVDDLDGLAAHVVIATDWGTTSDERPLVGPVGPGGDLG